VGGTRTGKKPPTGMGGRASGLVRGGGGGGRSWALRKVMEGDPIKNGEPEQKAWKKQGDGCMEGKINCVVKKNN